MSYVTYDFSPFINVAYWWTICNISFRFFLSSWKCYAVITLIGVSHLYHSLWDSNFYRSAFLDLFSMSFYFFFLQLNLLALLCDLGRFPIVSSTSLIWFLTVPGYLISTTMVLFELLINFLHVFFLNLWLLKSSYN